MYIDDDESCQKTFATLRLLHPTKDPATVTSRLMLMPTECFRQGEVRNARSIRFPTYTNSGWFICTSETINSRDLRRHLDYLLGLLANRGPQLSELRSDGWMTDVFCYWSSTQGHGGPVVSPAQMAGLAALDLELRLDIYGEGRATG